MTKETITYTDLNGIQRTEDFYFDLSKPEFVNRVMRANGNKQAAPMEHSRKSVRVSLRSYRQL